MTYEKVLQEMLENYGSTCGFVPADGSDLMIRLRTVAAAVWGIHKRVDALEKKCNIYTACGNDLDGFAALAGITRRSSVTAKGTVCFLLPSNPSAPVVIPKGTELLSVKYPEAVAVTTEDAVIATDSVEVKVTAELIDSDCAGLPSDAFSIIRQNIYPGLKVLAFEFSGGYAAESDEELRERVLKALAAPSNGVNLEYYKRLLNELPCVRDSAVESDGLGGITVTVIPSGTLTDDDTLSAVKEVLKEKCIFGHSVTVSCAEKFEFSFSINATLSQKGEAVGDIEEYATSLLNGYLRSKKFSDKLSAAEVYALYDSCGCFTDFTVSGISFPVTAGEKQELRAGYVFVSEA